VGFHRGCLSPKHERENGRPSISARIAFGVLYIKENENLVDHTAENPYMQYFLGLHEFQAEPLFDPSMMVHFCKRFPADKMEEINKLIFALVTLSACTKYVLLP